MNRQQEQTEQSRRRVSDIIPDRETIRRQVHLSLGKTVQFAWRNIRVRLGRSLLVTGGVVLAMAFLTYILCSDAVTRTVAENGPPELIQQLERQGRFDQISDADARVQTWWMVGLALMVTFVGIVNAMLLSVSERFDEIGTMKCLGARDTLVMKLFLLEGLFQGLVGTAGGIVIGAGLTLLEAAAIYGSAVWPLMPVGMLAGQLGLCIAAGTALAIAGALYPAWRAARMRPVEAMRSQV